MVKVRTYKFFFVILLFLLNFYLMQGSFAQEGSGNLEDGTSDINNSFIFNIPEVGKAACKIRVSPELLDFFKDSVSKAQTNLNSITVDQENKQVAFRMKVEPDKNVQSGEIQILFDILTIFQSVTKRDIAKVLLAGQRFVGKTLSNFVFERTFLDANQNVQKKIKLVTSSPDPSLNGQDQLSLATVSGRLRKLKKIDYNGEKISAGDGDEKVRFEASEESKLYIIQTENGQQVTHALESGIIVISCDFQNCPIEAADLKKIKECIQSGECKVGTTTNDQGNEESIVEEGF